MASVDTDRVAFAAAGEGRPARRVRLWRRVSLRRQMLYGFALPVVIVLMASWLLVRDLDSVEHGANAAVESSQAVTLRFQLLNAVLDAETGVRGFLLSGDPEFLQPYRKGVDDLSRVAARLEVTERGELAHIRRIHAAEATFAQWQSEFAVPMMALRKATPPGLASGLQHLQEQLTASAVPSDPAARQRADRPMLDLLERADPSDPETQDLRRIIEAVVDTGRLATADRAALERMQQDIQDREDRIIGTVQAKRGKRKIDAIRALMAASLQDEAVEERQAAAAATVGADRGRWTAALVPVSAVLLGLTLVLLLLIDAIRAIRATTRAAEVVAGGDLDKRVAVLRNDELGQLGEAFNAMAAELAEGRARTQALDRFQSLLATSNSSEELFQVVARMCEESFPGVSGAIYRIAASRNIAERVGAWGWPEAVNGRVIDPGDCRALRSGQPYLSGGGRLEVPCRHVEQLLQPVSRSFCLPLTAQGEILGILQLCRFGEALPPVSPRTIATAVLVSEQFAMALANLQLREQLRNQSIRDPLTGLFNRRYLEETMERELARSLRNGQSLAIATIDVDHFKRFNDTHGHEAGDKVLVELAALMRESIRSTDIACRYGGEEFVLLMPDSPVDVAMTRMQALCAKARTLRARVGAVELEPATISVGLAASPKDGDRGDVLLRNADLALYDAKSAGRDRVVRFHAPGDRPAPEVGTVRLDP